MEWESIIPLEWAEIAATAIVQNVIEDLKGRGGKGMPKITFEVSHNLMARLQESANRERLHCGRRDNYGYSGYFKNWREERGINMEKKTIDLGVLVRKLLLEEAITRGKPIKEVAAEHFSHEMIKKLGL
jgi:hypothetical protein